VESGRYFIKISYLGLDDKFMPFEILTESIDLGVITLKESDMSLSEVVITARTPPFKLSENGGIIANVSTTRLSTVGTANDVLQRMPGIIANNGNISIFGKGTPIVYINNRKINDHSELLRLESSDISTVELINNPGAKYDAEGRAVLLIKTKQRVDGFAAQATERTRIGNYIGDNENVNLSYSTDKLNLFATLFHNHTKHQSVENHSVVFKNDNEVWKFNSFDPSPLYKENAKQVSIGFDYSISGKHAIGGQYQYGNIDNSDILSTTTSTIVNDTPFETTQAYSQREYNNGQSLINAFYNGNFSDNYSLRFDFDYLKNHSNQEQYSNETINLSETNEVNILNENDYDLYAGKLTNSLKTANGLFEFGGEYNRITGSGYVRSIGYTDNSEYANREKKAAGFVSYSKQISSINLVAGLRYEYTSENSTENADMKPFIKRTYSDWYPNLVVSSKIKNADLSLSFNKRTQRPNFNQLNGHVKYINRFIFQKGNPYLNKTNIYNIDLHGIIKSFFFNIGYNYLRDPIVLSVEEKGNDANAILSTYTNLPKYQEITATVNFNQTISFWHPNYSIGAVKPFFTSIYDGREVSFNQPWGYLIAYNDFTLPSGFVLSGNFRYITKVNQYYQEGASRKQLDFGLRKSLFNNSLRLNLMFYDVFDWTKEHGTVKYDNVYWVTSKKYETRYATLSVTYMFNNYRKKYRGESAAENDLKRF
jgi:hypothetical protein